MEPTFRGPEGDIVIESHILRQFGRLAPCVLAISPVITPGLAADDSKEAWAALVKGGHVALPVRPAHQIQSRPMPRRDSWLSSIADYIASSYRLLLALSLAVGLGVSTAVMTFLPDVAKGQDPGLVLLLTFALPMVVTAIGLMVWARRRRHDGK
jgi:hypothetical protein